MAALLIASAARADASPSAEPAARDAVLVHISSDSDALRLVRVDRDGNQAVCAPPCDLLVPRGGRYRFVGEGMPPTRMFSLQDANGPLNLDVQAGSSVQRGIGIAAAGTGGAALLFAGGYALWLGMIDAVAEEHNDHLHDPILWGSLLGALVLGVGGGLLMATSGTWVQTSNGVSFSSASDPRSRAHRPRVTLTPTGLIF